MRKEQVIFVLGLMVVLASFAAVYQFYFKARLKEYSDRENQLNKLEDRLSDLEKAFRTTKPHVVLSKVKGEVLPREAEAKKRLTYFNWDGMLEYVPVPKNKLPKFHYDEQYQTMIQDIQRYAFTHRPQCTVYPGSFGFPPYGGMGNAGEKAVNNTLAKIAFTSAIVRLLVDANVLYIEQLAYMPDRVASEYGNIEERRIGLSLRMTTKDFVKFLEWLRQHEHHFSVNSFSLSNMVLQTPYEPWLNIQLILITSRARELPDGSVAGVSGSKGGNPLNEMMGRRSRRGPMRGGKDSAKESGALERFWKLIKNKVFLTN